MLNLFTSAASLLLGELPDGAVGQHAQRLLEALDYAPAGGFPAGAREIDAGTRHRARLLEIAAQFERIFELAAPDAPGLVSFAAELDPALADPLHQGCPKVSVSGVGLTPQEAFQGCVGEGIEYLSQLQSGNDLLSRLDSPETAVPDPQLREFAAMLAASRKEGNLGLSWYKAIRLSDRCAVQLPADVCLRRPPAQRQVTPPFPLSIGSAAGTSWEGAALHGLLELIERDAASLWWRGGRRGRVLPPRYDFETESLLGQLRAGDLTRRRTWLLDITTDNDIPAVAALSCRPDGFGFAFGLAARLTLPAAIRSAILEMCQIELAYAVVEAKRGEGGEAALNAADRTHLQRATMVHADECTLLHPVAEPVEHVIIDTTDPRSAVELLVRRLESLGIQTYGLDLTRPRFAVPVARIIAPGLQLEPSGSVTARLAEMMARTGGGALYAAGIPLI
jgi:ribosomal protein S12 methylthiotransferase accessory factor